MVHGNRPPLYENVLRAPLAFIDPLDSLESSETSFGVIQLPPGPVFPTVT